ncbi:MAG: zinc ribbon domain-containing protein [Prolixibacteraceae bacterium]|nr:zinc ribbon domain-containing protein [Prolixibacteraceae bacterium]
MNTCKNCGVELDVDMNFCPLCGQKSNITPRADTKKGEASEIHDHVDETYGFKDLTHTQKRKVIWELLTIILVSGIVVSFIVDLLVNRQITWSKYTVTSGLFLFINISLVIFFYKRMVLLLAGGFVAGALLMLALDWYSDGAGWGLGLGVPIMLSFYICSAIMAFVLNKTRRKGLNVIAYFLIVVSLFCMGVEGLLSLYQTNTLSLQWSVILMVSVVAVSAILLFIHYRLKRVTDLRRFFHI